MQREDFVGILREMAGLPVIIRVIDPRLQEFLPRYETLLVHVTKLRIAREDPDAFIRAATSEEDRALIVEDGKAGSDVATGIDALLPRKERLLEAVKGSRETNPMLGLRGCRLGIMFPEITEMQVRAIFEAACRLKKEGVDVRPEIMIPLVGLPEELRIERHALAKQAKSVMDREGISVDSKFGTMIEIPRAALVPDDVARHSESRSPASRQPTRSCATEPPGPRIPDRGREWRTSRVPPIFCSSCSSRPSPCLCSTSFGSGTLRGTAASPGQPF